ncbi:MAG: Sua5/YciO/YrdC/YwlC family protein [Bdellovibrionota bacterium]
MSIKHEEEFTSTFLSGKICLHPTDTVPGLTANPLSTAAIEQLNLLKSRSPLKAYIGLVADLTSAEKFWQPLPTIWHNALRNIWPAPLSIVWHASTNAPKCMLSSDKKICLRAPKLSQDFTWFSKVLSNIDIPIPTTSVNLSSEKPAKNWSEAKLFATEHDVYIPLLSNVNECQQQDNIPSTIIEIIDAEKFQILREGQIRLSDIEQNLKANEEKY